MSLLHVFDESGTQTLLRTTDVDVMTRELAARGIDLRRRPVRPLPADADEKTVLDAYREDVAEICAAGGYRLVDVAALRPDPGNAEWERTARAAREKFLYEHTHAEDEVRFFVGGRGCFYLHLDDRVYATVCEAGDLLSVPAGTKHWFDMGSVPDFQVIRFFEEEDGWIGSFTNSGASAPIPQLDELLAMA
jgi:1,2-dihydroxy-3-keto-5-methylthiopentene dioxygenase